MKPEQQWELEENGMRTRQKWCGMEADIEVRVVLIIGSAIRHLLYWPKISLSAISYVADCISVTKL